MRTIVILLFFHLSVLTACTAQNTKVVAVKSDSPVSIIRFDQEIYELIEKDDSLLFREIAEHYPEMFETFGKGVLNMQSIDMPGFLERLVNYFSEPTLLSLYKDALEKYSDIREIERQLGDGFAFVQANFPAISIPAAYMHVSGLNQNVLAGEKVLSVSMDKYMGKDYPIYEAFFYAYQRNLMTEKLIVPDYIAGLLLSEYPFEGNENVLLDRMIQEGKIKYLLEKALPEVTASELLGYVEKDMEWCEKNEKMLWRTIIGNKQLYTPDQMVTARYFQSQPSTFLADGAPGYIGVWLGWRIVTAYMNETNASAVELMQAKAQDVLSLSKYKP
jgi:Predicted Zn-dependent protease (DUF2268).